MDDPVLRVQCQLTNRDRVLLGWLYDHGVLTTFQIAHALFGSLDFCQRRLLTLYRLRLVGRFRPQRADGGSIVRPGGRLACPTRRGPMQPVGVIRLHDRDSS